MPSPSWSTLLDFLDQPAVAIRVAERDETVVVGPPGIEARGLSFRSEVERFAHIDSAIDELSPRGLDVPNPSPFRPRFGRTFCRKDKRVPFGLVARPL